MRSRFAAVVVGLFGSLVSCGGPTDETAPPERALSARVSPEWVTVYDPARAVGGYTLALFERKTPVLIDLAGHVVHDWPQVEARSRARLLPDGSLLVIALGGSKVQEHDWDGRLAWEFTSPDRLPHHDLIRLANGNTLVLVLDSETRTDDLLEVDPSGQVVWEWRSAGPLREAVAKRRNRRPSSANFTHINSVQELPPNRWHDAGDDRFRPGNLLLSARNLDALFIVDRVTGEVVWTLDRGFEQQHEAWMTTAEVDPSAAIYVFDNRPSARASRVVAIEPPSGAELWRYRAVGFHSRDKGAEQPLAGGNVLIVSSRSHRVFEITRGGDIVWQWETPFELQRPKRYPYGYAPQFAKLPRPAEVPVHAVDGARYVDRELYDFRAELELLSVESDGTEREVLPSRNRCRRILTPFAARLDLAYGLTGRETHTGSFARFTVTTRSLDDADEVEGEPADRVVRFEDLVPRETTLWQEQSIPLPALQHIRLCVAIETGAEGAWQRAAGGDAYWERVEIRSEASGRPAADRGGAGDGSDGLSAEQLEERRRHLEALGYID